MTLEEVRDKVLKIPFGKLVLLLERYEYDLTKRKVSNANIKRYMATIGDWVSVAQIMEALDYHRDDTTDVCARMRGMEKRKNQKVAAQVFNGVKHYRMLE